MLPGEIDLSGSQSTGARHFKNYLKYARQGEQALVRNDQVSNALEFDSQFEEAVYDALEQEGYDVVSQVESSGYSIDLAIKHPEQPGKFILGIECDGAAYHSSKTARDRDRDRQMVLEDLGWNIHRIWSPDWTSNKERELENIKQKVSALAENGSDSTGSETKSEQRGQTYEPEPLSDGSGSWQAHSEIESYVAPEASPRGDKEFSELNPSVIRNRMSAMVHKFGPIRKETLYRQVISQWNITRLGKSIRKSLEGHLLTLQQSGKVAQRDSFVWPPRDTLAFPIRIHEGAERDIDEVPIEELAKAAAVILAEGGPMTRDDLILETARIYRYQRRGSRIDGRIQSAIGILEEKNLIEIAGSDTVGPLREIETVEKILLNRIYT